MPHEPARSQPTKQSPSTPQVPPKALERTAQDDASKLAAVFDFWLDGDEKRLATVQRASTASTNERAYAAYLNALRQPSGAWEEFLKRYPRDAVSLEWLAHKSKGAVADAKLAQGCAAEPSECEPAAMADRLLALSEEGNALAVRTFVESWLTHADGGVSEWICRDFVPRLMKAVPTLLIEESAKRPKAANALKVCVQFSMAGELSEAALAQLAKQRPVTPEAATLLKEIVETVRQPTPDWP